MKKQTVSLTLLLLLAGGISGIAQFQPPSSPQPGANPPQASTAAPTAAFEEPPVLSASAILKPEYLAGPNFTVRDAVPTYSGANRFTIDTSFGVLQADGNLMLDQRIKEINAIVQMQQVSQSQEFADAMAKAATSPIALGKQLIDNPVGTVSGVPKGLWKFMNRAGQGIKEAADGRQKSKYEDNTVQNMIGFSATKRKIAVDFGVDPYSSDEEFQKQLNSLAWASFAGKLVVKGTMLVVSGGASAALTAVSATSNLNAVLKEKSPEDLRLMNLGKLLAMKIPRSEADAFLNNSVLSPTHQTIIVMSLEKLKGVSGKVSFLKATSNCVEESDAEFFAFTAALIASQQEQGAGIVKLTTLNGLPLCITRDNTVLIALMWDYMAWTATASQFADQLQARSFDGVKPAGYKLVITGDISPMAQAALQQRGIPFATRQLPGPGPLK